jgi:hypothetical protein
VACGDRLGDITTRTPSPDEARCASSSYATDPAVRIIAVYPTTPAALAIQDELRLGGGTPGRVRSKWRDRPSDERLLLCWYDGPIGIPRGGGPPADRFVVVRGVSLDELWVAAPSAFLPVRPDPP